MTEPDGETPVGSSTRSPHDPLLINSYSTSQEFDTSSLSNVHSLLFVLQMSTVRNNTCEIMSAVQMQRSDKTGSHEDHPTNGEGVNQMSPPGYVRAI